MVAAKEKLTDFCQSKHRLTALSVFRNHFTNNTPEYSISKKPFYFVFKKYIIDEILSIPNIPEL